MARCTCERSDDSRQTTIRTESSTRATKGDPPFRASRPGRLRLTGRRLSRNTASSNENITYIREAEKRLGRKLKRPPASGWSVILRFTAGSEDLIFHPAALATSATTRQPSNAIKAADRFNRTGHVIETRPHLTASPGGLTTLSLQITTVAKVARTFDDFAQAETPGEFRYW